MALVDDDVGEVVLGVKGRQEVASPSLVSTPSVWYVAMWMRAFLALFVPSGLRKTSAASEPKTFWKARAPVCGVRHGRRQTGRG